VFGDDEMMKLGVPSKADQCIRCRLVLAFSFQNPDTPLGDPAWLNTIDGKHNIPAG